MGKDKRLTENNVIELIHRTYDRLETISLNALSLTLKNELGYSEEQIKTFKKAYLMQLGEETEIFVNRLRSNLRRSH